MMNLETTIKQLDILIQKVETLSFQSSELDILKLKARNIINAAISNPEQAKDVKEALENIQFYILSLYPVSKKDEHNTWYNGKKAFIALLEMIKQDLTLENQYHPQSISNPSGNTLNKNSIFIVHGHDEAMKQSVNATLLKLGFTPIILNEEPNGGRTIIEKFEHVADTVGFAIILLSPDDQLFDHASENFRARQNVILELGYFFGKLGRNKVHVLVNKNHHDVELPSDIFGIVYETYDSSGAWKYKLAKELKNAGYEIDLNEL